ncbi:hypothetical protein RFI_30489 [Reticulomyxa filosa]|uniref:Uncharacterized protein n=1 Tax=Reticulomyxa filosa TaxID=46433 RepID=X6LYD2_RETFI|nr:hypothetical protein RFI_30489 [Reticulomyxa filosa]|eukprot:ETO06903.1 hypothetical protein RFI_30489 [Reticulomyxa filosa]
MALLWVVLDAWDFFSDIAFCWLLSLREKTQGLFVVSLLKILSSYIGKLFYMVHLLQSLDGVWRHSSRSGVVQLPALPNGNVWDALAIIEMVRVRTQRFMVNVIGQNVLSLLLQLIYFLSIAPSSQSQVIFYATVLSSSLSFLFSASYYFAHRSSYPNTAAYCFSFRMESHELADYMVHSQWRIQSAIQQVLHLNTPTTVVIDQCTTSRGENDIVVMRVEGRILTEMTKKKSQSNDERTDINLRYSVVNSLLTNDSDSRVKNEQMAQLLLSSLRVQFNLSANPMMQSWKISYLAPPQCLYHRKTQMFRFLRCFVLLLYFLLSESRPNKTLFVCMCEQEVGNPNGHINVNTTTVSTNTIITTSNGYDNNNNNNTNNNNNNNNNNRLPLLNVLGMEIKTLNTTSSVSPSVRSVTVSAQSSSIQIPTFFLPSSIKKRIELPLPKRAPLPPVPILKQTSTLRRVDLHHVRQLPVSSTSPNGPSANPHTPGLPLFNKGKELITKLFFINL